MSAKTKNKRRRISRTMESVTVEYRGKHRPVIVEIDLDAGTIATRLADCSQRKTYSVKDLHCWGPQLMLV